MNGIEYYLEEDIGDGDVTTDAIVPESSLSRAIIIAKADGVIAGHPFAREVFLALDDAVVYRIMKNDGERVVRGETVVVIEGKTRAILTGERTALNILQRLSGIATTTRRFVEAVGGAKAKILDTRKTSPGLRGMEKYAVRAGGGVNHRATLSEMALIKENHIEIAGSVTEAVRRVRSKAPDIPIEVEVKNKEELSEALQAEIDRIMLDNWDTESVKYAVSIVKGRIPLEASGNMTAERAREVAGTGVDFISAGALTHSYTSLDLSLLIEK